VCTVVHKYAPDFALFVLPCKSACNVEDALVRSECFENCVNVLVISVLVFIVFLYCFVYVYLFLFVTCVRTAATE
jgi:hypothetical protein